MFGVLSQHTDWVIRAVTIYQLAEHKGSHGWHISGGKEISLLFALIAKARLYCESFNASILTVRMFPKMAYMNTHSQQLCCVATCLV